MGDEPIEVLTQAVHDLTEATTRVEDRWVWTPTKHRRRTQRTIVVPSLIDQLRDLGGWPYGAAGPASGSHHQHPDRPPSADTRATATVAALDGVRHWSRMWTELLHLHKRDTLEAEIRALVPGAWASPPVVVARMARGGRLWVARARGVLQWGDRGDHVVVRRVLSCPDCGRPTLRVDLAGQRAQCEACGQTWGPRMIGILARRLAAGEAAPAAPDRTALDQDGG